MVRICFESSKRTKSIEKIKPNPIVKNDKESPTKKTRGIDFEIEEPDITLTIASAISPRKKFTEFESTVDTQKIRGSTRIFKNNFAPLEMDSADCNRP
jgi:hypothetical protein